MALCVGAICSMISSNAFQPSLIACAVFLRFPLLFLSFSSKGCTFVRALMSRDSKLEGLLDTEERRADGVYKGDMDDPQLCNPFSTSLWELEDLGRCHWDREVRHEASLLKEGRVVEREGRNVSRMGEDVTARHA